MQNLSLVPCIDYGPLTCCNFVNDFIYGDIEFHLLNAYALSFDYQESKMRHLEDNVPEFFDISDIFDGETGEIKVFKIGCFPYKILHSELTYEFLEEVLNGMKAEFVNMMGEHLNECQNILFEEMLP